MELPKKLRACRTVGALIRELERLPRGFPLELGFSKSVTPTIFNAGENAKELGLRPHLGFEETGC